MFSRHDSTRHDETAKGPSLARGPAWVVGLALSVIGLAMFFQAPGTPLSTSGFPDGNAVGDRALGFEMNAWTAWLTTAAGALVLVGAAQHMAARALSLIAGVALGAMAAMAVADGDVLGLAAANSATMIGWAVASGVLLVTALMPRYRRESETAPAAEAERAQGGNQSPRPPATEDRQERTDGVRSEPLRRTYEGSASTSSEREHDQDASEQEKTRSR